MISAIFMAGCDPVRTTSQPVRLRINRLTSGKPLAYEPVSIKPDDQTPRPQRDEVVQDDPWFHGVTDGDGRAVVGVKYTALDRSSGPKPPPERDWVTGTPYLVRVGEGDDPDTDVSVLMKPGTSTKGKAYEVTVIGIGSPRYVEAD
jgi:hypothetical protein